MNRIIFYPIGTKVKIGSVEGTITQIKMTGSKYNIVYLISRIVDEHHYESWMYDIEFSSTGHKVKMKFVIT